MNLLELFSGTHSVGKVANELGYNVISVDMCDYKGKHPPTHKCDIMEFDYKKYPKDFFTIIHGSPPCVFYSSLQSTWIGREKRDIKTKEKYVFTREIYEEKLKLSDTWVKKTLEIIDYFKPKLWFIENPKSGKLKNREFMKDIPYYDVDYCMYSDWGYKKSTRFWTNKKDFIPKICDKNCGNMVEVGEKTLHKKNCGNSKLQKITREHYRHKKDVGDVGGGTNRLMRYRIPPQLIKELLT